VLAKLVVATPILVSNTLLMLLVLGIFQRLPGFDTGVYGGLFLTFLLCGFASLAIGLLISAGSATTTQAFNLLPLFIVPNLLFSGMILPVPSMNFVGKAIAQLMVAKWTLNAAGNLTDLNGLFQNGSSPIGRALAAEYSDTFTLQAAWGWAALLAFLVIAMVLSSLALRRKGRSG